MEAIFVESPVGLPEPMRSDKLVYRFAVVVLGVTVIALVQRIEARKAGQSP